MRYKGLLTFEEADRCIDEGSSVDWLGYTTHGRSVLLSRVKRGWKWTYQSDDSLIDPSEYQGLAPTLGNPLPISTIRKDGSAMVLVTIKGFNVEGCWDERQKHLIGNWTELYREDWFKGWYPVVTRED